MMMMMRSHLTRDAGMQALQILCRQVMSRTDVSDAELKEAVRTPAKENTATSVARRLAQWDADLAALRARGYTVDDHDLRTGLLRMVSRIESFDPVVAALKVGGVAFDAARLRKVLGDQADQVKADPKPLKQAVAKAARTGHGGGTNKTAAAAVQALASQLSSFPKPKPAKDGKANAGMCYDFRDTGNCAKGKQCKFRERELHLLKPWVPNYKISYGSNIAPDLEDPRPCDLEDPSGPSQTPPGGGAITSLRPVSPTL